MTGQYHYQLPIPKNEEKVKLKAAEMSKLYWFKNEIYRIHLAELLGSGLSQGMIKAIYVMEQPEMTQSNPVHHTNKHQDYQSLFRSNNPMPFISNTHIHHLTTTFDTYPKDVFSYQDQLITPIHQPPTR